MTSDLGAKTANAAKWSVATQVAAKLISPITTMILARLLTPMAFGVVASATMVTSLADLISDAGFQRYLVQHDFGDDDALSLAACVAFWTNLFVSLFAVTLVFVARDWLATAVGNPGMGMVLVVASLSLPLTSLVSVQTGLYQRDLDFRTLFTSRIWSSVVVLVVSVSLAWCGASYWSMVAGTLASNVVLAIWLTLQSKWKPQVRYSFATLWEMLSFGVWVLGESVATWVNSNAGIFIIGTMLSAQDVGYFKTTTNMCNSILGVVTASILPVAYSTLSKVQNDRARFETIFLKMQGFLATCLVPLAVGVFCYRGLCVEVLLGSQWQEVSLFFGLWMLMSCIVVVFGYMCSEAYRAVGKPSYSVVVQVTYLVPYLIGLWMAARGGFERITIVMPFVRLFLLAINLTVMRMTIGISPAKMFWNVKWVYVQTALAALASRGVSYFVPDIVGQLLGVMTMAIVYVVLLIAVPATRAWVVELTQKLGLAKAVEE